MSQKTQKIILRVGAIIFFLLFLFSLLYYYAEEYLPFIYHHFGWDTYLPSALRMICRIGYPVACVGIFLYKRWAAILLIMVWLIQLLPSVIYFLISSGSLNGGIYTSLVTFIPTVAFLYWCRKLFVGQILKPLLFFFVIALVGHTAYYLHVHNIF
jgi:hypothetical protein